MATKAVKKLPPGVFGLKHDDCLDDTPDVQEALRRLPQKLVDERNYRIIRAFQLSTTKTILPRDQWTKYEEDDHYLEPYIKEVIKEREEKEMWQKTY